MRKFIAILLILLFSISVNDDIFGDSIPPLHSYKKVTENGQYVFVMLTEGDPSFTSSEKRYPYSGLYFNDETNVPIWTVDWYSALEKSIFVSSDGKHLVRINELTSLPDYDEPSIIFYESGKEIKEYSASELVKDIKTLPQTASGRWWMKYHLTVFDDNLNQLTIVTNDAEEYVFNIKSGEVVIANSQLIITKQQALEIAKECLREEIGEYGKEFIENSAKAADMGNEWYVTFRRIEENCTPSTGIISVDKSRGKAKWIPQR